MTRLTSLVLAALLLVIAVLVASLGAAPDGPTLTEAQQWKLLAHVQAVQLSQAKLEAVVKDLTVPGYELNLQTMTYQPVAAK